MKYNIKPAVSREGGAELLMIDVKSSRLYPVTTEFTTRQHCIVYSMNIE